MIRIESAGHKHENELVSLYQRVHPRAGWNEAHFRWRYLDNPAGRAKIFLVCVGRIAAYTAVLPQVTSLGGERVRAWLMVDAMTEPEMRGRGLFNTLAERLVAEASAANMLCVGFPNALAERTWFRVGFRPVYRVPEWRMPVRGHSGAAGDAREFVAISSFTAVERLWRSSGLTGTDRTTAYLDWRYRRPGQTYHCLMDRDKTCFIALKLYKSGDGLITNVCDVIGDGTEAAIGRGLEQAERFARVAGATLITTWLPYTHCYASVYRCFGLEPAPSERWVIAHVPTAWNDRTFCEWHLTQSDSDVF